MAQHPDAPTILVDLVMASYGARALRHLLGDRVSESDLRTDLSDIVATVVNAMTLPYDGVERRRVVDLDSGQVLAR
jgi:hypothetical protein